MDYFVEYRKIIAMLYCLVVVYNKKIKDSCTMSCIESNLKKIDKAKVIVFDNSTADYKNREYSEKLGYKYFGFMKNFGLSKAYNYAIKNAKIKDEDYIMVLDDDTEVSEEYFDKVLKAIRDEKGDILLPIVKAGDQIISPVIMRPHKKVKPIVSIYKSDKKWLTAINSGMVVRREVYNSVMYSEDIFLDYVDHDFMLRIRDTGFRIEILDTELKQNYSRNEKVTLEKALARFRIFKNDYKVFSLKHKEYARYKRSLLKYAIKECLRYKKMVFLRELYVD